MIDFEKQVSAILIAFGPVILITEIAPPVAVDNATIVSSEIYLIL
jgi:hypothetical protein